MRATTRNRYCVRRLAPTLLACHNQCITDIERRCISVHARIFYPPLNILPSSFLIRTGFENKLSWGCLTNSGSEIVNVVVCSNFVEKSAIY